MDQHIEMLGKIKSKDDFIVFMRLFAPTADDPSVKCYLESLTAWAADMDGYYRNTGKEIPADINWDFIASLLYAGSIYE
ncbi:MAG TPA: hypothetical protein DCG49_08040 [Ruminococcus sp.]|nr:hypothetical protein [Ruminococcus sp.]